MTRKVDAQSKQVTYTFGSIPPLTVRLVAELLSDQCKSGYAAFEAFRKLIGEHEEAIASHNL